MNNDNLYSQPSADIVSRETLSELSVHGPVRRSASHGFDWLADAWALFRRRPLALFGAAFLLWLLVLALNLVMMFIPFIGSIVPTLLSPIFGVGLLQIAHSMDRGEGMEISDIFAGFRHQTGPLLGLGALFLLLVIIFVVVTMVAVFVIFGGDILNQLGEVSQQGGAPPAPPSFGPDVAIKAGVFVLVFITLIFMMAGAVWFAPALVYFGGVHPVAAMLQSLGAMFRNIVPMTVYGLALLGFWILALLVPVLVMVVPVALAGEMTASPETAFAQLGVWGVLGMVGVLLAYLMVMVVAVISIYTAFRDIFIAPR